MQQQPETATGTSWLDRFRHQSESGRLAADVDWSANPLGHPDAWSAGLKTAVGIVFATRFPMLVVWGPDLIKIYNDAYAEILGPDKHPRAVGAPAREIWPEIWDVIGPMFEQVMTTGEATWSEHQRLDIVRDGFLEEAYFTFSYSPVRGDDDEIEGTLDTVTETTGQVLNARRLACLGELTGELVASRQVTDVCVRAVAALSRAHHDIPTAEVHLKVADRHVLVAANHRDPADVASVATIREVATSGEATVLDDGWSPGRPARRYALPIGEDGAEGVLVVGLNPMRPFDDEYRRFVELLARNVGIALENAYRRSVELGEQRLISDTLQNAMLVPASDIPTVAARYLPAVGNLSVGGDWYDVISLPDGRRALVVGDCVGHGLAAATAMGQLRSASRALLYEGNTPAEVLEAMDRFAATVEGAPSATMVCSVIDVATGTVTYASAGHPPPLVVGPTRSAWLDEGRGLPLAVEARPRQDAVALLAEDDVVVLYTDGLVERRGEDLDVGLERLRTLTESAVGSHVHDIADALIHDLLDPEGRDDVALVVKRMSPSARP